MEEKTLYPFEEWTIQQVQDWFNKQREFSSFKEKFAFPGTILARLEKEDFQKEIGNNILGAALYQAVKELKGPKEVKGSEMDDLNKRVSEISLQSKDLDTRNLLKEKFRKKDLLRPTQLETNFPPNNKMMQREESFKEFIRLLQVADPHDRRALLGTQAAPGCGKTTFLNYIIENLARVKDPNFIEESCSWVANLLPVAITFNGGTPLTSNFDLELEYQVSLRILASLYGADESEQIPIISNELWSNFLRSCANVPKLKSINISSTINHAIDVAKEHGKTGILLLVDETMKIGNQNVISILTILCSQLAKRKEEFCLLVTSLNPQPIFRSSRGSSRDSKFINLPLINEDYSIEIFSKWSLSKEMKYCIQDCNGHPRSLLSMYRVFMKNDAATLNYDTLMLLATAEYGKIASFPIPSEQLVIACLKGRRINIHQKISEMELQEWLASGALINSGAIRDTEIPVMSPFFLYNFCEKSQDSYLAIALKKLLNYKTNPGWSSYEKFHEYWESIIRICYNNEKVSLRTLYHLDHPIFIDNDYAYLRNLPSFIARIRELKPVSGILTTNARIMHPAIEPISPGQYGDYILIAEDGSEAIEAAIFEFYKDTHDSAEALVIGIQCKYSDPTSVIKLDKQEITKAANTFNKLVQDCCKTVTDLTAKHSVFVVAASRYIAQNSPTTKSELEAEHIILLSPEHQQIIYTQTLTSRWRAFNKEYVNPSKKRFQLLHE